MISGIVHVLKSGGRWADAPPGYGPHKTLNNRFVRWAAKGVWEDIFRALAAAGGPPAQVMIDSTAVRAHRLACGGNGRACSGHRTVPWRTNHQNPCPERSAWAAARLPDARRSGCRLHRRRPSVGVSGIPCLAGLC